MQEAYLKLEDIRSLLLLHVELGKWKEAFELARSRPELKLESVIYTPYAKWLADHDQFEQAQVGTASRGGPWLASNTPCRAL